MDEEIFLLALDPSTDVTGVALLRFERGGSRQVLATAALRAPRDADLSGDALQRRIQRIAAIRWQLGSWLSPWTGHIEAVAYEYHTGRGGAASEAISEATGAYLTLSPLPQAAQYRVVPSQAKAVWGGTRLRREEAKPAVVRWARREFGLTLSDTEDAIGDALAVAVAGWGQWRAGLVRAQQGSLSGPCGGKL